MAVDSTILAAGATAGSGLLQGILSLEAQRRAQRLQREMFDIQRADERKRLEEEREIGARQQIIAQPGTESTRETQTLQNLIANLRGTI